MKLVELAELAEPSELAKLMELVELAEQLKLEELAELLERTETTDWNICVFVCPFNRSNRQLPCAAGRAEQPDSLHRSTRSGMQHVDVDCVEMHPFAAPPASDEFLRASLRSAHAWVRHTAQVSRRPAVQKLLAHNEFGVMLAGVYLDNVAKHTGRVGRRSAASVWVWFATEWMSDDDLLQQLLLHVWDYCPFVWTGTACYDYDRRAAGTWNALLIKHERESLFAACANAEVEDVC